MIKKFTLFLSMSILTLSGFAFAQPSRSGFGADTGGINPGTPGSDSLQGEGFLSVIQNGINWILGIMAFIALIVLLWGAFQMVTAAGNEEKYGKGFTILKQAAIGLILMGVAWFIVSIIFSVIATATGGAGTP